MRYANLSIFTQLFMIGLVAIVMAAFLTTVTVFFRGKYAGFRPLYPSSWTGTQCRALESFRLMVGFALIALWGFFLFNASSMPTSWPFGYLEITSLITLLLISLAWVMFLYFWNWKLLGEDFRSFWVSMVVIAVWWGAVFTATVWMFTQASASLPLHSYLNNVFAAQGELFLGKTIG